MSVMPGAIASRPPPPPELRLLFVDTDAMANRCQRALMDGVRIVLVSTVDAARRVMGQTAISALVTELVLPDGSGIALCRAAKGLPHPPAVLVTTREPQRVPDAIDAGCDGVLLKPFLPNLLFARLGRLLRSHAEEPSRDGTRQARQFSGSMEIRQVTTNEYWPDSACPHCKHLGVTTFDFASYRRAWYACLACRAVWVARHQNDR